MGLDITAFSKLRLVEQPTQQEIEDCEVLRVFNMDDFKARAEGLVDGGYYRTSDDTVDFRAGSYSGYNQWREALAKLAGYPSTRHQDLGRPQYLYAAGAWASESGPFYELINFADNEGIIGPVVAAKLVKDFAEFDERAKTFDEQPWFYDMFKLWRRAFEKAADSGAVEFH